MDRQPWVDDVIGYMLGSEQTSNFFKDYHEKKPLVVSRDDPKRFKDLLSFERIDEMVSSLEFPTGTLDMTSASKSLTREDYTFSSGVADRGAVSRHFQNGATLILPQLHQSDARLASFCHAMEAVFSCHLQTNIYLTPPDAQGFNTHYDDHDVFVMQVSGSKTWRFYDTPVANPYRGEGFQSGAHDIGEPTQEFVMNAGDCIYVPRGLMHDARTHGDEASLHITVGLIVKTWADLMLEVVSEVALRNPDFRRALPAGFARPDFDRTEAIEHFEKISQALATDTDPEAALDLFVDNHIRSRTPDTTGTLCGFQTPLKPGQKFSLRPLTPWRLAEDGEQIVIITSGGEVRFPADAEPALHTLLDGGEISAASFDALSDEAATETVQKLYAYGLTIPVEK
jgi:lysine-specific demethylase/histidyl-hydroxylase NO66